MAKVEVKIGISGESIENGSEYITISSNLENVSCVSELATDASSLSYGVIPSSAEFTMVDANGEIAELIKSKRIPSSKAPLLVYVNDNLIYSGISTNSSYDVSDNKFSISAEDSLMEWDSITYIGHKVEFEPRSAYSLIQEVLLSANYSLSDIEDMLTDVKVLLENIEIGYPFLEKGTLRQTINKFCDIAQMYCYKNRVGKIKFVDARPVFSDWSKTPPIRITADCIKEPMVSDLFVKNAFNAVNITEKKIVDNENESKEYSVSINVDSSIESQMGITIDNINSLQSSFGTSANILATIYAMVIAKNYYIEGSFIVEESLSSNIDFSNASIDYSINYKQFEDLVDAYADIKLDNDGNTQSFEFTSLKYGEQNSVIDRIGKLQTTIPFSYSLVGQTATTTLNLGSEDNFSLSENADGSWTVSYKVLVSQEFLQLEGQKGPFLIAHFSDFGKDGSQTKYIKRVGQSILFNIAGYTREIKLEDYNVSDFISSSSVVADIPSNELLQENTKIYSYSKLSDNIKNEVKMYYQNGISTADVALYCKDLYHFDSTLAYKWNDGEILNLGDVVFFTNDMNQNNKQRLWRVVRIQFVYDGEPYINVSLQELYQLGGLSTLTWNQIAKLSEYGLSDKMLSVGDSRSFHYDDGRVVTYKIVGFKHDDLSDNSGKASITFAVSTTIDDWYGLMNQTDTNIGGWAECYARTHILPQIMDSFESDLKENIKCVKKKTTIGGQSSEISETDDFIWLFSYTEVYDNDSSLDTYDKEGNIYEYWAEGSGYNKLLYKETGEYKENGSWLATIETIGPTIFRSPYLNSNIGFVYANTNGTAFPNSFPFSATNKAFYRIGFCI